MMSKLLIICFLISGTVKAQLNTVADFENKVICNYLQTEPFVDKVRTNIHSGNASISCATVKDIPSTTKNINDSPVKIDYQKKNGLVCYYIVSPTYRDDRRGHMHGGHSAISCIKPKKTSN